MVAVHVDWSLSLRVHLWHTALVLLLLQLEGAGVVAMLGWVEQTDEAVTTTVTVCVTFSVTV